MTEINTTPRIKQCKSGDKCVHPLGSLLPATREYFSPDKDSRDGLTSYCKPCRSRQRCEYTHKRLADPEWREQHNEKARIRQANRYAANPELHEAKKKRDCQREAEKRQAPDFNEKRKAKRNVTAENRSRSIRRALDPDYREHQNMQMSERRLQLGEEWRDQDNEYKRQERQSNPEKPHARDAVKRAVKLGTLPVVSNLPCVDCGAQAEHYHHADYSKPLEVVALCQFCHGARHRRNQ